MGGRKKKMEPRRRAVQSKIPRIHFKKRGDNLDRTAKWVKLPFYSSCSCAFSSFAFVCKKKKKTLHLSNSESKVLNVVHLSSGFSTFFFKISLSLLHLLLFSLFPLFLLFHDFSSFYPNALFQCFNLCWLFYKLTFDIDTVQVPYNDNKFVRTAHTDSPSFHLECNQPQICRKYKSRDLYVIFCF